MTEITVWLATDSAATAHLSPECGSLVRRPTWGGEPVEVTVPAPVDATWVTLRTVTGTRLLRCCRRCWITGGKA